MIALDPALSTPLYRQLADGLKEDIQQGVLHPGTKIGTQSDFATQYGVSVITIKRAFSELSREGLIYSRAGLGTFVSDGHAGSARASGVPVPTHRTLGMVLRELRSPYFSLIVEAVERFAYEAGYSIMLSAVGDEQDKEKLQLNRFQEMGVQGIIMASMQPDHSATPTLRALHASGFPYVMVSYVADAGIVQVGTDHASGARWATQHLIEQGYRRIGFLAAEPENRLSLVREEGFRQAMQSSGLPVEERWILRAESEGERNHYGAGNSRGRQVAAAPGRPEAFFAYNDLLAIGFMEAVLEAGLRVPEDIAIVGFDDIVRSRYAPVPLTTVRQRTPEIGRTAVDVLLRRMAGDVVPDRTTIVPELVVRSSSGCRSALPHHSPFSAPEIQ